MASPCRVQIDSPSQCHNERDGCHVTNVVEQFAVQLTPAESQVLADLRSFIDWQTQSQIEMFTPQTIDDVAIRSYLLHLRLSGISRSTSQRTLASLKRFYDWAQAAQLIIESPFCRFDFNRPLLSREQIKRRQETRFADPMHREITHLRALNHLAEHLNRSCDVRSLLARVVETTRASDGTQDGLDFLLDGSGSPHDDWCF
jgi:Phage integrase, N-terminal SAM-like domain